MGGAGRGRRAFRPQSGSDIYERSEWKKELRSATAVAL